MIRTKTLKSGIKLIMEKMPQTQSAAIGIWVKTGANNETRDISGISHFIEHMMFKGTKQRSAKQIAEDVDNLGGQINAFTGKEATCYYIKSLSSNLEKSFDILLDMFTESVFDKAEMKREKMVVAEEMNMVKDTPDEDALDTISELLFKGQPPANNILGTKSSLAKITQKKIKEYIDRQYTKDSIVVAVAGNFDERVIARMIDERMLHLRPKQPKLTWPNVKYEPRRVLKIKDIEQSHICLGKRTISAADDRYYPMMLLSSIMGGSMSSRLFQNVREQKGLAYAVYAMNSAYTRSGYYSIYAGVGHDRIKEAMTAIKQEHQAIKKNGITPDELAKAKEQLKAAYIFGQESVNARMFAMGKSMILSGKPRQTNEVIKNIDKVGMTDIERAIKLISDFDRYSMVVVTNKKRDVKNIW